MVDKVSDNFTAEQLRAIRQVFLDIDEEMYGDQFGRGKIPVDTIPISMRQFQNNYIEPTTLETIPAGYIEILPTSFPTERRSMIGYYNHETGDFYISKKVAGGAMTAPEKHCNINEYANIRTGVPQNLPALLQNTIIGKDIEYRGVSKNGETKSYDFTVDGSPLSYATIDNQEFNIWANWGDGAKFTGESFKASEVSTSKFDIEVMKTAYNRQKVTEIQQRDVQRLPTNGLSYDISMENMISIKRVGRADHSWGRKYTGSEDEVIEACVFAAKEARLNPDHLASFIEHESGFNPNRVSPTGAVGLGQFTKGTWEDMAHNYPVYRDGNRYKGLESAYPEFNWGIGNRDEIVQNALATAHYMSYNITGKAEEISMMKSDLVSDSRSSKGNIPHVYDVERTVGYIAHNIGPTGARRFFDQYEKNCDTLCSGKSLVVNNPINYTIQGTPISHKDAYDRIDSHMNRSLQKAKDRGYDPDRAYNSIEQSRDFSNNKFSGMDKGNDGQKLADNGVAQTNGETGLIPQEVMDHALAQAQAKSASPTA